MTIAVAQKDISIGKINIFSLTEAVENLGRNADVVEVG
jgi:hypothetical protein